MKYCVENDLRIFEFHDAVLSLVSYDGQDLVVSASLLNVHKGIPQNPCAIDMEIASARIEFRNFKSPTYELGRTWKTGENGEPYPVGPRVVYTGQEAMERILEELRYGLSVYDFEKEETGGYYIDGSGAEPYCVIGFDFDGIAVSWDAFSKKAWYELHRQYHCDGVLHTPAGDRPVQLHIMIHEEAVYFNGEREEPPVVNVGCKVDGKQYWGRGKDLLLTDALEDLGSQLPEGTTIEKL